MAAAYNPAQREAPLCIGHPKDNKPAWGWVQALQELTRIAVQSKTGRFSRLILDVGGSRETRQQQLEKLVDRAIARLDDGASQASLPAMSSYERKLVHDIVADRGLVSESYGEGAQRHTVIRRA